jgi:hypothetical protein
VGIENGLAKLYSSEFEGEGVTVASSIDSSEGGETDFKGCTSVPEAAGTSLNGPGSVPRRCFPLWLLHQH